jgi:hypothetical protein
VSLATGVLIMTGNDEDWEPSASDDDEIDCTPSTVASKSRAGSTMPSSARSIRKRARDSNPASAFSGKKSMLDVLGKKPPKLSKPKAGGKGGGEVGEILSDCFSFGFDYLAFIIILDKRCAFTKLRHIEPCCVREWKALPLSTGPDGIVKTGRPQSFYLKHFSPADPELRDEPRELLHKKNVAMECKHCGFTRKFNPCTKLKMHLLRACKKFPETEHWDDPDVVSEVAKLLKVSTSLGSI